jgi:hypothetical protein
MNMRERKFFIMSVVFILCAIFVHFVVVSYSSRSARALAKSTASGSASEAEKAAAQAESERLGRSANILGLVSLGLAVFCAVAWYIAARNEEPVWHVPLLCLFAIWGMLQFVMT